MIYHYTSVIMVKIQNMDNIKCWQECGATGALIHCQWECKIVQPLQRIIQQFLTKLNILLPFDPAITCLCSYSNELKIYAHIKTCTWMFIAALFIIAKTDTSRCLSVGGWKKHTTTLWYIYTMGQYSFTERNELLRCEQRWGNLKYKLLSERSQSEKATNYTIPTI